MKRLLKSSLLSMVILSSLALLSFLTTGVIWDGGFPSSELRLNVQNDKGQPVKGAVLQVFRSGTQEPAFGYPLDDYLPGKNLVSDENGEIIAVRKVGRPQFGGHSWLLFWIIPLGDKPPEYDCVINSAGYKPYTFSIWSLFDSPYKYYEEFPKVWRTVDGEEIELPVYEHTFILDR